ncbi:helix-turn-helix domain-containing protein [Actinorugispora endophytica]|uniref:Helix-turn-helix protein n=1 Tax=Actinorugispora endophytica TaxID=1605990 RepID=A0A4R6UXK5_9ACTN|nr:helix-turn-helix transcriptional regulator [Actinorugispora endophytica]TDQ52197.1 helix-turn-helix protein [Actinorugispora endophytica]
MSADQPTVTSRGLGAELRSLRKERRLSSTKIAEQLGWVQSKISKIETGKQKVTPTDVASLLAVYGVTGHERDRMIIKAENAGELGLWEKQGGMSRDSHTLIQLEAEATSIFNLEPLVLPGLLQTPDYTRALMKSGNIPESDVEVRVAARLGRQAILSRDDAPAVEFVIDEGVLRRLMVPAKPMARQLRHVVETSERPNVTVRVLPLSLGGHSGLDGSFMLLDFARQKPVVHVEHKISALFLEEPHEIEVYRSEVANLREITLKPAASVDFISAIARELDQE